MVWPRGICPGALGLKLYFLTIDLGTHEEVGKVVMKIRKCHHHGEVVHHEVRQYWDPEFHDNGVAESWELIGYQCSECMREDEEDTEDY